MGEQVQPDPNVRARLDGAIHEAEVTAGGAGDHKNMRRYRDGARDRSHVGWWSVVAVLALNACVSGVPGGESDAAARACETMDGMPPMVMRQVRDDFIGGTMFSNPGSAQRLISICPDLVRLAIAAPAPVTDVAYLNSEVTNCSSDSAEGIVGNWDDRSVTVEVTIIFGEVARLRNTASAGPFLLAPGKRAQWSVTAPDIAEGGACRVLVSVELVAAGG